MPRRLADGYDPVAIVLHWLIATLIAGLLVLGFVMTRQSMDPALQFPLFQWHKSFGMLALLLAAVRLVHSLTVARVKPVEGLTALEERAAQAMHCLLLVLAVVVPVAGWMIASVSPLEIPTFAFNLVVIPHLPMPKSDAAEALWATVHAVLAYSTLALVFLHSGAALYHHYVRHDDALARMLGSRHRSVKTSIEEPGP